MNVSIIDIKCFRGRNIYSHKPVIKAVVTLDNCYDTPTKSIPGFNKHILHILPGLSNHHCSLGYAGGFAERLDEGTYLAHVTEHITLELQCVLGYETHFGKTRLLREPNLYNIVFEYENEILAIECLISAVGIVNSLISMEVPDSSEILQNLRKLDSETSLGPSTKAIYVEAKKRGIPVTRLGNDSILRLGTGEYSRYLEASLTDKASCISIDIAGNKHLTKSILSGNGIPVPCGEIAYTERAAAILADRLGYPVVVKPCDANQGKGVTLNVLNEAELYEAFNEATKYSRSVIVEKYVSGRDYRVLVTDGRVAAVAERNPPFVTGDGIHTVEELVQTENENPKRGYGHEKPLTKIILDNTALGILRKEGLNFKSVPFPAQQVYLRKNGNLSTGGTARDCTDEIHPLNCEYAIKAAQLLGLDIAGVDITAPDISKPIKQGEGAVIEVNAAPGLRMHLFPTIGKARNVAGKILDILYPEGKEFSVPIVSITGTNGKTTVTRLTAHVLATSGKTVGMTCTSGIYIGGQCVSKGDNTGPASAEIVLSDKSVQAAVLETARGGLIRKGLGYDLADVGVIVNISEDHLGLDGIETIDDLAYAKSLVIEAVRKDGYVVLNTCDKATPLLIDRAKCNVIMFGMYPDTKLLKDHMKKGGKAVFCREDMIYIYDGCSESRFIDIKDIPITFNGKAQCNIENSLAAISAMTALNIPSKTIREGLLSFKPDMVNNPGRFNIFEFSNFKVVLDYGHNPAGYLAVVKWMKQIHKGRYVGVVGMPGDRSDSSIKQVGTICGNEFSRLYIKEDEDLRGRSVGETAGILYNAAISTGMDKNFVRVMGSEQDALETAILNAEAGDLIVVFYESLHQSVELIEKLKNSQRYVPPGNFPVKPLIQSQTINYHPIFAPQLVQNEEPAGSVAPQEGQNTVAGC